MNHKHKVFILGFTLIAIMVSIGFLINIDGSITGSSVVDQVACYEDTDCDDRISATKDICRNPGTVYSLCINK